MKQVKYLDEDYGETYGKKIRKSIFTSGSRIVAILRNVFLER